MSILEELKAMEDKLRGLRNAPGDGAGYNYPGGKQLRIKRGRSKAVAARGRKKKEVNHEPE